MGVFPELRRIPFIHLLAQTLLTEAQALVASL